MCRDMWRRWLRLAATAVWLVAGYLAFLTDASPLAREVAIFGSATVMLAVFTATRERSDV